MLLLEKSGPSEDGAHAKVPGRGTQRAKTPGRGIWPCKGPRTVWSFAYWSMKACVAGAEGAGREKHGPGQAGLWDSGDCCGGHGHGCQGQVGTGWR